MSFENTRIYKLLSSLDAVTLNRFAKFIHSPYFNVNEKITNLFDIIHNALKKGIAVQSKEELWNKVGFAVSYKDIKFRKLCNDLVERFERFLMIENLEKDKTLASNLLLRSIITNEYGQLTEKHISKTSNIFERVPDRSSDYYLQKYTYEKSIQNLKRNYEKRENIHKYVNTETYKGLSVQLDVFYFIEKLRFAIDIITWQKQYNINMPFDLKSIKSDIKKRNLQDFIVIEIYYLLLEVLSETKNVNDFFKLKNLAKNNINVFPKSEQVEVFDALFTYCVSWVNKGNIDFLKEYLDIHDWGISEDFILNKNYLSPTTFTNYIIIGLRLGEFDRVENYINNNIILLDEDIRENALNFNLARLAWYKKEFNDVISFLNKVNYDDIFYNINSKILLLATYYEIDEIDVLFSLMESYSTFLRREKSLDSSRKLRHKNFIKYLRKLVNSYSNKSKIKKLKNEVELDNEIVNKSWLLEKIDEQLN